MITEEEYQNYITGCIHVFSSNNMYVCFRCKKIKTKRDAYFIVEMRGPTTGDAIIYDYSLDFCLPCWHGMAGHHFDLDTRIKIEPIDTASPKRIVVIPTPASMSSSQNFITDDE